MHMNMKRYQVYLNPHSVSVMDEVERMIGVSRSKLIREATDRFVQAISSIISAAKMQHHKKSNLDNLIGIIDLKDKKKTNYALEDDEIYLRD